MANSRNVETILAYCRTWESHDLDQLMSYFAEDCFFHNIPIDPVVGVAQIRELIGSWMRNIDDTQIIMKFIAETDDGVVLTERLDRMLIKDKWVDCPVMGTFELEDGKIKRWRDYYDNAKLYAQMG
jgi:limonene-1,2-epoxide hydrolase